jgi:predicted kinase
MGERVVVDASWLDPSERTAARELARATTSELAELRCVLPVEAAAARAAARARAGGDASDADARVARALATRAPSWAEATDIPTAGTAADSLALALAALGEQTERDAPAERA